MQATSGRVESGVIATVTGISIWLSIGAVALVDPESMDRIGALPPWWALAAILIACHVGAHAGRFRADHLRPLLLTVLLWLPWLPLPVPAAFMIWQGPVAGLVWGGALLGLVAARWPHPVTQTRALGDDRHAPLAATLMVAVAYMTAAVAVSPRVPTGDEPHYLVITQSVLLDGDLRIENNHLRGDYLDYYGGGQLRPDYLRRGVDGEIYSVHPPGVSALVLPAFALAGHGGAVVFLSLLMAAGGLGAWRTALLVTGDRGSAWFGWAAVMLTTPVVFHAFTVYPDGPGAVAVMVGMLSLVRMEVLGARAVGRVELAAVGAAMAALPWLHTRFAIVAGVIGGAILIRQWRTHDRAPRAAAFMAVPIASAVAWFGYFWALYGTPNPAAAYGGYTQSTLWYALTGLPGLLLDQQFGLLVSAPVYLVALAGMLPLFRTRPRLAVELGLVIVPYIVAVGSYAMWWGGFSAPARFAVVTLLVCAVPAAVAWQAWPGRVARSFMAVSLACSIVVATVLCAVGAGELLYEGRTGYAAWLDWASTTASLALVLPSIHRGPVVVALLVTAAWALALTLAFVWLAMLAARRMPSAGGWWLATGLSLGTAGMLASTLAWAIEREPAVNSAASQMAFLARWNPQVLDVGVRLGAVRLLDADEVPPHLLLASPGRRGLLAPDIPLLAIPRVPAGEYDVVLRGRGPVAGTLSVSAGREERLLDTWTLDGRDSPDPGLRLTLPVELHSITVRGDAAALAAVDEVMLRPRAIRGGRLRGEYAPRAGRYGQARVFFLDDHAFPEGGGFWTRGREWTTVVIAPDGQARPVVRLHGGRVATPIDLRVGAWSWRGLVAPDGVQEVSLPSVIAGDAVRLEVKAEEGFLPLEHDPDTLDDRHLGVWVEVR